MSHLLISSDGSEFSQAAQEFVAGLPFSERPDVRLIAVTPLPVTLSEYYVEDVLKEAMKYLSRHPNRRPPSKHDWACRALASRFDSGATERVLNWKPQGTREALVERGIRLSVQDALQ